MIQDMMNLIQPATDRHSISSGFSIGRVCLDTIQVVQAEHHIIWKPYSDFKSNVNTLVFNFLNRRRQRTATCWISLLTLILYSLFCLAHLNKKHVVFHLHNPLVLPKRIIE
ncbi:hypothetical protein DVB69_05305 [Sporosarcina sp. BI001-red]|nr:hypothetical protein DVB69_05305 [Sporosarcina sp. BI001-red]